MLRQELLAMAPLVWCSKHHVWRLLRRCDCCSNLLVASAARCSTIVQ